MKRWAIAVILAVLMVLPDLAQAWSFWDFPGRRGPQVLLDDVIYTRPHLYRRTTSTTTTVRSSARRTYRSDIRRTYHGGRSPILDIGTTMDEYLRGRAATTVSSGARRTYLGGCVPTPKPDKCPDERWGGCCGIERCCPEETPVPSCYDPPGGRGVSVCRPIYDGTSSIDPSCHCIDMHGDQYNIGDCVTCGSGWCVCRKGPRGGCGWARASPRQCPGGGGVGSGQSSTTTTIPYGITKVAYAVLHDGTAPEYPVLEVRCTTTKKGDKYRAYYYAGRKVCRFSSGPRPWAYVPGGWGGPAGSSEAQVCTDAGPAEWRACEQGPEWDGNTARFLCEYGENGRPTKVMCKWEGSGCVRPPGIRPGPPGPRPGRPYLLPTRRPHPPLVPPSPRRGRREMVRVRRVSGPHRPSPFTKEGGVGEGGFNPLAVPRRAAAGHAVRARATAGSPLPATCPLPPLSSNLPLRLPCAAGPKPGGVAGATRQARGRDGAR